MELFQIECGCCPFNAPIKAFDGLEMMKTETLFNENLKEADEKEQDNLGAETDHMCPQENGFISSFRDISYVTYIFDL